MDADKDLFKQWEKRWEGSQQSERLTPLGRLMFKAKEATLREVLKEVHISSVLEAGCGLGHTLGIYHHSGLKASGIDVSSSAVQVCRRKGLVAEVRSLEEVDETFDLVSSDGMLEHFLHFEPHARDLMRVSRRYVLLIQPNHDSFVGKTLAYLAELLRGNENVFEYNYRIRDFVDVFARNGFELKLSRPIFMDVFRLLLFERQGGPR